MISCPPDSRSPPGRPDLLRAALDPAWESPLRGDDRGDGVWDDYIARAKKDESSGAVISQVSVAVMDGGKAIGTLTIGVNVQALP